MPDSVQNKSKYNDMYKMYELIGSLREKVAKATSMDVGLRDGLRMITEIGGADMVITWYRNEDEDDSLRPYYWIGSIDFSTGIYQKGSGLVGRAVEKDENIRMLSYGKGEDPVSDQLFAPMEITSMVCTPFSNQSETLGCIQFVKTEGVFSSEQADIFEIFANFLTMEIFKETSHTNVKKPGKLLLSARGIKRQFKNGDTISQVLKGVNLDVYEGEFLVILGESGCGKSTFLNIIGGMDQANDGTFIFRDQDFSHATQEQLTIYRRENIGFIFQKYNLMPNLNAIQNLELIAELVEQPMDCEKALEMVGLAEKQKSYPSHLSGGQQQRVSIARALVKNPTLIFADEPTAALDYTTSIEVLTVLEEIVKKGTTLVMVTHNEEITRMADRIVRMRYGKTYEITVNRNPVHASELVW